MAIPLNADLVRLVSSSEFVTFVEHIKGELEVDITAFVQPNSSTTTSATSPNSPDSCGEPFFRLRCQRSNSDSVSTAREMLETFLVQNNVQVYQSTGGHKRSDSFADAFPHFNSKLLSTSTAGHAPGSSSLVVVGFWNPRLNSYAWSDSPDFVRGADITASPDRRVRLASSTPDVKALFNNSPSYVYKLPEHEEQDEVRSGYGGEYWPSLGPPPMVRVYPFMLNSTFTNLRSTVAYWPRGSCPPLKTQRGPHQTRL